VMRHTEQEYLMKKKRKGSDELRNQISCMFFPLSFFLFFCVISLLSLTPCLVIYSFVSENMKPSTLVENENLRQIFLGWISVCMHYPFIS